MDAVQKRLVRIGDKLIQLFDPPFDKGAFSPATSKDMCRASARTAVNTPTPPPGLPGDGVAGSRRPRHGTWNLINPVYHATTAEEVQHYKVEPYVVCADVYGAPPHTGRGGWTWYTGSASWLYRVAIETILGFQLRGAHFVSSHASRRAGRDSN